MSTPPDTPETDFAPPEPPPAPERARSLDRRYLAGCVAGLLIGGALGVPSAYALLRVSGEARTCTEGPSREQRDAQLAAGLRALSQKDAARALEIFRQMERATPADATVHNNICVALNDLGRYAEAVDSCTSALDLAPGYALAKNNLAWARAQRDRAAPRAAPVGR